MTLEVLKQAAEDCSYRQVPWAKDAGINPTRLNLALNGHISLKQAELDALESALRVFIGARVAALRQVSAQLSAREMATV